MRRTLAALLAAALLAVVAAGCGGDDAKRYHVIVDNAFGLTEGADLKAAGVRIGSIEALDVQRGTARADVTVKVEREDFGSLRTDARCSIEPQSLIGEYFMDCEPGTGRPLSDGATIPVEQTTTTIPVDLVQNVLRRPYRERLGIILTEFGVAFGARGPDLAATIRRAVPALRETDRVLAILARNRRELRSLISNGNTVLTALAGNRGDVARFVSEARDTAQATAERRGDLARQIDLFPRFFRELRPVLRGLETAAREQTPALADLRAASGDLEGLLRRLGPFAEASEPALRSLGRTGRTGVEAAKAAESTIEQLRGLAARAPEPLNNLRFILEHLDDRDFAVGKYPFSPNGQGFTGLEAFLWYPFVQSQAINVFDTRGYLLKLNALINQCTGYANAETVERNENNLRENCSAALGPSSPGIDERPASSDPSPGPVGPSQARARTRSGTRASTPQRSSGQRAARRQPGTRLTLPGIGDLDVPVDVPRPKLPRPGQTTAPQTTALDYLLAP